MSGTMLGDKREKTNKKVPALDSVAQLVGMSSHAPKGEGFDSQSGTGPVVGSIRRDAYGNDQ